MPKTWTVTDLDGKNPRQHTVESLRAEIEAAKKRAMEIFIAETVSEFSSRAERAHAANRNGHRCIAPRNEGR